MSETTGVAAPETEAQEAAMPRAERSEANTQKPRTMKVGRVVSDKMEKTVVVAVDSVHRHRLYHKRVTRTSKFLAHDERNLCRPGDLVRIEETRPLSKRKRWIVRQILDRGVQV
jgi:small subunit ribosomal protein S17